jgi:GNAT superfamily N-acetyltransferase
VTTLSVLGRNELGAIEALCRRALPDPPSVDELDGALFAPEQPAVVRGDPSTGVVATVECEDGTHVRLLTVDPDARGLGQGHALLEAAEADARTAGSRSLTIGADSPYFLWPGVPSNATPLLCLFERHHYARVETNFDMTVDLTAIPDDPGGHAPATQEERPEVDAWMATHWPNWRLEVLRALDKGNLVLDRADGDITAFCAFEVNRAGFLGPVAVRLDLMGRGRGRGVLLGALHELRRRGRDRIDVSWVGPVVPYASVGGHVSNVYFVYRRELA